MLRSRQRSIWLLGIATVWIVGVYVVYQKATSANLLSTWPKAKHQQLDPANAEDKAVDNFLTNLGQLEQAEAVNSETYADLNKKFLYYIDKKFRSKGAKGKADGAPGDPASDPDALKLNALPQPNDGGPSDVGIRIPVLVFACNRVSVSKCLDNLLKYRPNAHQFPIIVSQVNTEYIRDDCTCFVVVVASVVAVIDVLNFYEFPPYFI